MGIRAVMVGLARARMTALLSTPALAALLALFASSAFAGECPNEAIRARQGITHMPECRAYEMVSPPEKNGAEVLFNSGSVFAAASGGRAAFSALAAFGGIQSNPTVPEYLSTRGESGWSTDAISPPMDPEISPYTNPRYQGFSSALTDGILYASHPLVENAASGTSSLYLRDLNTGEYKLLSVPFPSFTSIFAFEPQVAYAASDANLHHITFESEEAWTFGAPEGVRNLYEASEGQTRLVGILPNESPATGGSAAPVGDAAFNSYGAAKYYSEAGTVSADGSHVLFTAPINESEPPQLYMREDHAHTVLVSPDQRTIPDPHGPQPAEFQGASADLSRIFFTSSQELTNNAYTGTADKGRDLYEYDVQTKELTDLTPDPADEAGAEVLGVLGASADGAYVYFAAHGNLVPGTEGNKEKLYVWHEGTVSLVVTGPLEEADWLHIDAEPNTARMTPDGTRLLFAAKGKLTSYENHSKTEFYLYSASTGKLTCVSCSRVNTTATSGAFTDVAAGGVNQRTGYVPRILTENGDRAFFDTSEALLPGDVNGQADVYEWRADGTSGCGDEEGCLSLISGGNGNSPSYFADATSDGAEVYFVTRQALVAQDEDASLDLYDSRIGGGIPEQNRPAAGPSCEGTGCRGATLPPPLLLKAGSEAVTVSGNESTQGQKARGVTRSASSRRAANRRILERRLKRCRTRFRDPHKRRACVRRAFHTSKLDGGRGR